MRLQHSRRLDMRPYRMLGLCTKKLCRNQHQALKFWPLRSMLLFRRCAAFFCEFVAIADPHYTPEPPICTKTTLRLGRGIASGGLPA